MKIFKRVQVVLLALSLFLVVPDSLYAQQQVSMKIQPTLIEEKVDPGMVITRTVSIANLGDTTQTLYPVTKDITAIGPDGRPIYSTQKPDQDGMALSSWITFEDKEVTVAAKGSRQIQFTIRVPSNASPGSHFGGVFLSYKAPSEMQNATGVGYEIGTVINLQISGKIVESAAIRSFSTNKAIYGEAKVHFATKVENSGNVFIRPHGLIEVYNMFNKKVDTRPLNDAAAGVLPAGTRVFESDWLPENIQIGHFKAVAALSFGDQGAQTISSETDFWILPMNIVLPVLGGLLALILVVYILLRIYVRRQLAMVTGGRGARRENAVGLSRLAAVIIAILVAVIIGLLVLFFYFG